MRVRQLDLRCFTPREVANLICFPQEFGFPPGLTDRQCYQTLGNNLNVKVVSVLISDVVLVFYYIVTQWHGMFCMSDLRLGACVASWLRDKAYTT